MSKFLSVEEFTTPCPVCVSPKTSLSSVSNLMNKHGIRHITVVDNAIPVGVISERDLRVVEKFPAWVSFQVGDVMTKDPYSVSYDEKIDAVALEMSRRKIGSAVVLNEVGEIFGIFTTTDALNALVEIVRGEV